MAGSHQRFRLLLSAAVTVLLGCGTIAASAVNPPPGGPTPKPSPDVPGFSLYLIPQLGWGDLAAYVDSLPHDQKYTALNDQPCQLGQLGPTCRPDKIGEMFDAIQTAGCSLLLTGLPTDDSINAVTAAKMAGYQLGRYYDKDSKLWFIVGQDSSGTGQAYFFINPQPLRLLIIEAPHVFHEPKEVHLETATGAEGAHLLLETQGWALLINGADRCKASNGVTATDKSNCFGHFKDDDPCPGEKNSIDHPYHRSDVGHNDDSAFHVLHMKFNDFSVGTVFVQLHGNTSDDIQSGGVFVSDSREWPMGASGLATIFVNAITKPQGALEAHHVKDCTTKSGDCTTKSCLCGYENAQGRYTNTNDPSVKCTVSAPKDKGGERFLHLEQKVQDKNYGLIDDSQPVSDALNMMFPSQTKYFRCWDRRDLLLDLGPFYPKFHPEHLLCPECGVKKVLQGQQQE